jgi:hypothetical protein
MKRGQVWAWQREYLAAERELTTARDECHPDRIAAMMATGLTGSPSVESQVQERKDRYRAALLAWKAIQDEADGGEASC